MIAPHVNRDAALIFVSAFVRSSTVGLIGVIVAIYLVQVGLSTVAVGAAIGAGLAGAALATLVVGFRGDAVGRRRTLAALALLSALGFVALALANRVVVLVPLAFAGMLNGMGRDRGAASALEQAVLPATTSDERRTWILALYNVVLDAGHAVGALAGATPTMFVRLLHTQPVTAHRMTFWLCAGAMVATVASYAALSSRVEVAANTVLKQTGRVAPSTRGAIRRLMVLFGIDSLGGGFLSSALIGYWFFQRFGTSEAKLAGLFFAARVLNATGHVAAAWIARRIGLVNTMVLTHLPSSLFIMAAPIAPTVTVASILFLCREALVEMDVPTRQSYVMAIVAPSERTVASGVTNVTRNVGWAVGPSIAGFVMQQTLAAPLVIGGALKIGYDVLLYAAFRNIRPPEERSLHQRRDLDA
jgi:MFS family permease